VTRPPLPVLGWKEQGALPDLGVSRLRMKLDTGARSSALHVEDLETIGEHTVDGEALPVLRFDVLVGSRDDPGRVTVEVPAVGWKMVRDTGAKAERRPVVRTRVVCGPLETVADVTITSRHGMNFRMLLGRLTLAGHCVVDPMHGYLHSPTPPRRRRDAT
jgi:hypothetical protein